MTVGRRVLDWLDERAGVRALAAVVCDEPVPGGARWSYVFGSCLVFLLVEQMVTGILLASSYAPTTTDAWASVAHIQDRITLGWLVRGLHSAGASAMVILILAHMLQVTIFGAYKRPRELNWLIGLALLGLTLGFALTGYLLPWDQKGYWATQVATSLLGALPLVGHGLQTLVQGGERYGNLTLTHFYALHVLVLPGAVVTFTAIHVWLFRRHGVTPSWTQSEEELARTSVPFYPNQLLRDLVAIALMLAIMVAQVVRSHGASLEAPADPAAPYDARPEWYFLPLFQLLKLFPGRAEVPAAVGAPLLVIGLLVALPFRDRGPGRSPARRLRYIGSVMAVVGISVAFGLAATREDAASETYQRERERADREAMRARMLAAPGIAPAGGTAVFDNDPETRARKLFAVRCAGCHLLDGGGENKAPTLDGWGSRRWLAGLLVDPDGDAYFGRTKIHGMKPVPGSDDERRALVEYVHGLGEAAGVDAGLRARGEALFTEKDCDECHEVDGVTPGQGPNLGGRGSRDWLRAFLRDPSEGRFYGKRNEMPRFGEKLSADEIDALVDLLLRQRGG